MDKISNKKGFPKRNTKLYERLGICSLTDIKNIKNQKMWEEYGANGKGIILVYEFSDYEYYSYKGRYWFEKEFYTLFSNNNILEKQKYIYPVIYFNTDFEEQRNFHDLYTLENNEVFLKRISHIKQDKFSFELEWRLLKFFPYSIKEKGGEYIDKKISEIILGKKVVDFFLKHEDVLSNEEKENLNQIINYCKENKIPIKCIKED